MEWAWSGSKSPLPSALHCSRADKSSRGEVGVRVEEKEEGKEEAKGKFNFVKRSDRGKERERVMRTKRSEWAKKF